MTGRMFLVRVPIENLSVVNSVPALASVMVGTFRVVVSPVSPFIGTVFLSSERLER